MDKTMLLAGKDLTEGADFANSALLAGRKTAVSVKTDSKTENLNGIASLGWNTGSALSARSLVLQCENALGHLDEAVLYFDEVLYSRIYSGFTVESSTRIAQELTAGFQYLTLELLSRAEKKQGDKPAKIIFLYRPNGSVRDELHGASSRNRTGPLPSPSVSAAAAAFTSFAENTAAFAGDRPYISIVLVRCDENSDAAKTDGAVASWLCGYLDALDSLRTKPSAKQSTFWVKTGAKNPGGFSLFH